jgi:hypothetical protein
LQRARPRRKTPRSALVVKIGSPVQKPRFRRYRSMTARRALTGVFTLKLRRPDASRAAREQ